VYPGALVDTSIGRPSIPRFDSQHRIERRRRPESTIEPEDSVKDAPSDGEIWVINTSERITGEGVANSPAKATPKGCTIISARGTVGKLAMAGVPMAFNQSCYDMIPGDGKSFCHMHLLMQTAVAELQQRTHGSVFDTITQATFDSLFVALPPSDVITSFESEVAPLFDLLLTSLQETSKLAELRDYGQHAVHGHGYKRA